MDSYLLIICYFVLFGITEYIFILPLAVIGMITKAPTVTYAITKLIGSTILSGLLASCLIFQSNVNIASVLLVVIILILNWANFMKKKDDDSSGDHLNNYKTNFNMVKLNESIFPYTLLIISLGILSFELIESSTFFMLIYLIYEYILNFILEVKVLKLIFIIGVISYSLNFFTQALIYISAFSFSVFSKK